MFSYKVLLIVGLIIILLLLIYTEIRNISSNTNKVIQNANKQMRYSLNKAIARFDENMDVCINRVKNISSDNLNQLKKIHILNQQPILANSFTETESVFDNKRKDIFKGQSHYYMSDIDEAAQSERSSDYKDHNTKNSNDYTDNKKINCDTVQQVNKEAINNIDDNRNSDYNNDNNDNNDDDVDKDDTTEEINIDVEDFNNQQDFFAMLKGALNFELSDNIMDIDDDDDSVVIQELDSPQRYIQEVDDNNSDYDNDSDNLDNNVSYESEQEEEHEEQEDDNESEQEEDGGDDNESEQDEEQEDDNESEQDEEQEDDNESEQEEEQEHDNDSEQEEEQEDEEDGGEDNESEQDEEQEDDEDGADEEYDDNNGSDSENLDPDDSSEQDLLDMLERNEKKKEFSSLEEEVRSAMESEYTGTVSIGGTVRPKISKETVDSEDLKDITISELKSIDSYNASTIKKLAKSLGVSLTVKKKDKRVNYTKTELYDKIKTTLKNKSK